MECEALIAFRREALAAVVPYAAVRRFPAKGVFDTFVTERISSFATYPGQHILRSGGEDAPVYFLYQELPWDTAFFGFKAARLRTVLFAPAVGLPALAAAVADFTHRLRTMGVRHCYVEVAPQDPALLYALGRAGWSTVESRLHYYHDQLGQLPAPRYAVRAATPVEAGALRRIAATNPNAFDRFHADPAFSPAQAGAFLGEYAVAAVAGFCDEVLVPAHEPLDSFLAVSHLAADAAALGTGLGRLVLTAVGSENRGWHRKLVAEALWRTRERGGEVVFMTTQATNRAVIHNSEQLGFRLGGTTHILSSVV